SRTRFLDAWNPRGLAPVRRDARRYPRSSSVTELAIQTAFTLWWVRPNALFSLESHGRTWSAGETWARLHGAFFVPVLLLSFVLGALALARLLHPQETPLRGWISAGTHWASALIAAFVLAGGWKTVATEWRWLRHMAPATFQEAAFLTAVTDVLIYLCVASVGI